MFIAATIISNQSGWFEAMPCSMIEYILPDPSLLPRAFPSCADFASGGNPEQWTVVPADITNAPTPAHAAAALRLSFGMAAWLAFSLHAAGVEIYVSSWPKGKAPFSRCRLT
jgi:hypothetical protein